MCIYGLSTRTPPTTTAASTTHYTRKVTSYNDTSWVNVEFYAHETVPFILRVHPSTEKRGSFSAERDKCRVYFSKIHHMERTSLQNCLEAQFVQRRH